MNVWKGLVIGALTGAAVGVALDLGERGGRGVSAGVSALGGAVAHHAPEVAEQVRHTLSDAATTVSNRAHDSELPTQVKAATAAASGKVADVASQGVHAASQGLHKAGEAAAGPGRDRVTQAVDRAKDVAGAS
jgi:hypothetical protein